MHLHLVHALASVKCASTGLGDHDRDFCFCRFKGLTEEDMLILQHIQKSGNQGECSSCCAQHRHP